MLRSVLHKFLRSQTGAENWQADFAKIQEDPSGSVEAFRAEIVEQAQNQFQFYRDRIKTEIWAEVPLLEKPELRDFAKGLIGSSLPPGATLNSSGGSTGAPVQFIQDQRYLKWSFITSLYYHREFLNFDFFEGRKLVLWGSERDLLQSSIGIKAHLKNWLTNTVFFNTFALSDAKVQECISLINKMKPEYIRGYAGSLALVASWVNKNNIAIHKPDIIYSSAETLTGQMREEIEKAFKTKVHDFYGSREVGPMAGECKHGHLHIFQFNNFIEILNSSGEHVAPGEEGKVVVTNLHNRSMPLIRYVIGDVAEYGGTKCDCGSALPYLTKIRGRVTDYFTTTSGTKVHGEFFTHLMYHKKWVKEFQFVQKKTDLIEIKYVPLSNLPATEKQEMEKDIKHVMGDDVSIVWDLVDSIPLTPQGKYLYTKSEVT